MFQFELFFRSEIAHFCIRRQFFLSRKISKMNVLPIPLFFYLLNCDKIVLMCCNNNPELSPDSYHFRSQRSNISSLDKKENFTPLDEPPWRRAKILKDELFRRYSSIVRPSINQSETVNVWLNIKLKQLVKVDIKDEQARF